MTTTDQNIPNNGDDRYVAGDTAIIEDTIVDDSGDPKNLSGGAIAFALADYPGGPVHVEKTTSDDDVQITDAANGVVEITLRSDDTASLGSHDGTDYYYEIALEDGNDNQATVTTGTWTIYADTATIPA